MPGNGSYSNPKSNCFRWLIQPVMGFFNLRLQITTHIEKRRGTGTTIHIFVAAANRHIGPATIQINREQNRWNG